MREAVSQRTTHETSVEVSVQIEGVGKVTSQTGIGFFDHMLDLLGKHSLMNLSITAQGDLEVDCHHTVEDVGITLGEALKKALDKKEQINRYGHSLIPMEEALVLCAIDLSGRPYVEVDTPFTTPRLGDFDTEMVEEFFRAVAQHGGINLHIQVLRGKNNHHIIEGMFKAFARALKMAMAIDEKTIGIPSTKGILEV